MSVFWVYVDALEEAGEVVLTPDEARHLQARRLRVGDALVAFDGAGRVAEARVVSLARRATTIEVEPPERHERSGDGFVLASAVPKGDRLSTMLQMMTQLGVDRWQPLVLDESVVRKLDPASARLRRVLVESAKVARRPWLMRVEAPTDLEGAIESHAAPVGGGGVRFWFGDREGRNRALPDAARLVVIGPEAGFSERERERLATLGGESIALSDYNLRIEVAAIAAATARRIGRRRADEEIEQS